MLLKLLGMIPRKMLKKTCEPDSPKSPEDIYNIFNDPVVFASNFKPSTPKLSEKNRNYIEMIP